MSASSPKQHPVVALTAALLVASSHWDEQNNGAEQRSSSGQAATRFSIDQAKARAIRRRPAAELMHEPAVLKYEQAPG